MTKRVLLIIASDGFHPTEYKDTKKVLEDAGYFVTTASNKPGEAISSDKREYKKDILSNKDTNFKVDIDLLISEVKASNYNGIFIIGGSGTLDYLDNKEMYNFLRTIDMPNQLYGAICISPRIFINANLVSGKYFTGWDGDNQLQKIADDAGLKLTNTQVTADGNFITANGPEAAKEFGEAIVNKFKDSF